MRQRCYKSESIFQIIGSVVVPTISRAAVKTWENRYALKMEAPLKNNSNSPQYGYSGYNEH